MFPKLPGVSFEGPIHLNMEPFLPNDSNITGESLQLYHPNLSAGAIVLTLGSPTYNYFHQHLLSQSVELYSSSCPLRAEKGALCSYHSHSYNDHLLRAEEHPLSTQTYNRRVGHGQCYNNSSVLIQSNP
jgi:hypothetical protein